MTVSDTHRTFPSFSIAFTVTITEQDLSFVVIYLLNLERILRILSDS